MRVFNVFWAWKSLFYRKIPSEEIGGISGGKEQSLVQEIASEWEEIWELCLECKNPSRNVKKIFQKLVLFLEKNSRKSKWWDGLLHGSLRSSRSVCASTGIYLEHKDRKTANHFVRDGYFETSECRWGLGDSYYAANSQNSFGGVLRRVSVENKNVSLRCHGSFHNPTFCHFI